MIHRSRFAIVYGLLAFVLAAAAFTVGHLQPAKTKTLTRTLTRSPYTHPTQTLDGAQVNQAFAGMKCDLYQAQHTVVCHP